MQYHLIVTHPFTTAVFRSLEKWSNILVGMWIGGRVKGGNGGSDKFRIELQAEQTLEIGD